MKKRTVIFYFSQSGNSLYVAKEIAKSMEDATLISIPKAMHNNEYTYSKYENIGFVMPLYFMNMPKMVQEFISRLEINKDSYVFSVITRASSRGRIFYEINELLEQKQSKLNYAQYITFPDSYIRWIQGPKDKKRTKILENARNSLESIKTNILGEQNYIEKESTIVKIFSLVAYNTWMATLKSKGKSFKVNDHCIGCGICEQTCPAKNIRLEKNKPVWSNKCEDCMACVQHCPKKAIYFNSRTGCKERYINPNIKLEELLYNSK